MIARFTGWLLGLDRVASVDRVRGSLGAEWATTGSGPFWFCLGLMAMVAGVILFYWKYQRLGSSPTRGILAGARILLLLLLLVTMAEPMMRITVSRDELPELFVALDATASMALRDGYETNQLAALAAATGLGDTLSDGRPSPSRQDYVRAWLGRRADGDSGASLLARLDAAGSCRLRLFCFDGQTDSQVRELASNQGEAKSIDWQQVAAQLGTTGQVTALGSVLRSLSRQPGHRQIAGVILISDFGQNAGEHPLDSSDAAVKSPLDELGVPVHTIGVGAVRNRDLAVQIHTEAKIRRGESTIVSVRIQQSQLRGETVVVRLFALASASDVSAGQTEVVAEREVKLDDESHMLEIPYLPARAGEIQLRVELPILPGEVVVDNNAATHRIQVIDDFIRLLYVAYEPTWEWRFVKEVFHRDPAVGLRGFRTYLASSDPRVRQSNPLFLPALTQNRSDFFATDVLFLDDLPKAALTPRFCAMAEQFVRDLGGGLVVIAGPRFGPAQLIDTPLAKMLPVILDPHARLQDQREFAIQLTPRAREFPFMQLDDDAAANQQAWSTLHDLPWYQGVTNIHEQAVVLAQHPTDKCLDGKTPQPLIAIRRYGAGEVVYLGFNETWRLRRQYGEKYYRRFWLPLIDRLGLSHALGARKRFVVRMDRPRYRIEDEAVVSVQAYDDNYEPLEPGDLEGESLPAELLQVNENGDTSPVDTLRVGAVRPGLFETRFPLHVEGVYRIRVKDPITDSPAERQFSVTGASAEMRSSVRDEALQTRIAEQSHGFSCTLANANQLLDHMEMTPYRCTEQHNYAIWKTPMWFILIVALMLGEWSLRKWMHLT